VENVVERLMFFEEKVTVRGLEIHAKRSGKRGELFEILPGSVVFGDSTENLHPLFPPKRPQLHDSSTGKRLSVQSGEHIR